MMNEYSTKRSSSVTANDEHTERVVDDHAALGCNGRFNNDCAERKLMVLGV
jgi:hypothetical protein